MTDKGIIEAFRNDRPWGEKNNEGYEITALLWFFQHQGYLPVTTGGQVLILEFSKALNWKDAH